MRARPARTDNLPNSGVTFRISRETRKGCVADYKHAGNKDNFGRDSDLFCPPNAVARTCAAAGPAPDVRGRCSDRCSDRCTNEPANHRREPRPFRRLPRPCPVLARTPRVPCPPVSRLLMSPAHLARLSPLASMCACSKPLWRALAASPHSPREHTSLKAHTSHAPPGGGA